MAQGFAEHVFIFAIDRLHQKDGANLAIVDHQVDPWVPELDIILDPDDDDESQRVQSGNKKTKPTREIPEEATMRTGLCLCD